MWRNKGRICYVVGVNYLLSYCQLKRCVLQSDHIQTGLGHAWPCAVPHDSSASWCRYPCSSEAGPQACRAQRFVEDDTTGGGGHSAINNWVALLFLKKFFPAPSKLIAYCSVFSVGERSGIIFRNWQKPFEPHHLVKLSDIIGCTLFLSKKMRCQS